MQARMSGVPYRANGPAVERMTRLGPAMRSASPSDKDAMMVSEGEEGRESASAASFEASRPANAHRSEGNRLATVLAKYCATSLPVKPVQPTMVTSNDLRDIYIYLDMDMDRGCGGGLFSAS
jgi:hypothetical protein